MQEQIMSEQKPVSFLAEKLRRMPANADANEMNALMRDYLTNERNAHAVVIYENTTGTARVIPFARMRALG